MAYRDRPVHCPRCGVGLARDEAREMWLCRACRGALVGTGELVRELVRVAPDLVPEGGFAGISTIGRRSDAPALACPVCGDDMNPVFLGGVEIDRCYHDEFAWFDRGELDRVLDRARDQHVKREDSWLRKLVAQWFGDE